MVIKKVDLERNAYYYNEQGKFHREDGPAIEWKSGAKSWYIDGLCHRIDGPAREYPNKSKAYYIMGKYYFYEDWLAIKDFPLLW